MFDGGGFQLTGGIAGMAAYAVFSLFVSGPLVGERLAERQDWGTICKSQIRAEAEAERPPPQPQISGLCTLVFGGFADGQSFCNIHGGLLDGPVDALTGILREQEQALHGKRLSHAAGQASSRCACAVSLTLEKHRLALALHTGSLRILTPAPVKTFKSELISSLNAPHCTRKG